MSPNSGHERQAELQFVQTRGRAGTWLTAGTWLIAGTQLTALRLLSALRQLRPGCHGTVRLVTHSSLWPEQKRQMKARKRNRGTEESSNFPEVRQQSSGRCWHGMGRRGAWRGGRCHTRCSSDMPHCEEAPQRAIWMRPTAGFERAFPQAQRRR